MLSKLLFLIATLTYIQASYAVDIMSVNLRDGSELQVNVYKADGDSLLVVFPSSHGITDGLNGLAEKLSDKGIETWIANPFDTWFLPEVESSMAEISVSAYSELILHAEKTDKNIYLFSNDNGAGTLLEAAHTWQLLSDSVLSGVILVSPNLFKNTPEAGNRGQFLTIAKATNLPIFIYMPSKSTLSLRIKSTIDALEEGGSDVYVQKLENVRNRFFFRLDATDLESRMASTFSDKIIRSMELSTAYAKQRKPIKTTKSFSKRSKKTTGVLRKYTGQLRPDDFTLSDINGVSHSLSQYTGKVIVVNFWASWCPPCVHEMPSMSSLNMELKDSPFEILAINLGENPDDINRFLKTHPVNFPVLLDPDQALPGKWNVFAFPTSYLLDKKGFIRYSVAGGIDWSSNNVKMAIHNLLMREQ